MTKEWRDLELLVADLEKKLGGTDIIVTSPDYIEDKTTGKKREIDITLRGNLGSFNVLIIIEVRDRDNNEDVTWIEQISTKRDDVGANKAIAVSSYGFSQGAIDKAKAKNIELRTIKEISESDYHSLFAGVAVPYLQRQFLINNVLFRVPKEEENNFSKLTNEKVGTDNPIIQKTDQKIPVSINELFKQIQNVETFWDGLESGERIRRDVTISSGDPYDLKLIYNGDLIRIEQIVISVELWLDYFLIPVQKVEEYKKQESSIAQIITFKEVEIPEGKLSLRVTLI